MIGLLNIYLDQNLEYSWRRASEVVAKTQGRGTNHARRIREWVLGFLKRRDLPLHQLNWKRLTILDDEDIAEDIKTRMMEKGKGFMKAEDVVEIVASPEIQEVFAQKGVTKPSISVRTAHRWLEKMGWTYGKLKHGLYLDGHERPDVVEYRQQFVERWMGHERRFHRWDHNGTELPRPNGFPVPGAIGRFRLILVTHDESTFFQNDERNTGWSHTTSKSLPKAKGNGQSLMVSDFLTPDWGRLRDDDQFTSHIFTSTREARVIFKAGKNRDGFFDADDLLQQVDKAIDIFEGRTNGWAQGLFLFDNAPSHRRRAPDAISARNMVKGPKEGWTHQPNGLRMRDGTLPNGKHQSFYFPDDHPSMPGWFKGMEVIIRERGLWPADRDLLAQCPLGSGCPPDRTDCCCRRILFLQPDFVSQKSQLQELVESRGHLCDFYPKYHCELNFIEQYWGAAKLRFRMAGRATTINEMERKVIQCLDDIPLLHIRRYANRSARFISAYHAGLSGSQAVWANRKYHSHRTLPPEIIAEVRRSVMP
ncbi:hypothetical protein BC826DRAFT_924333 [Russula brevipes]|nr:hypothetical protein BC826DRAFT_924333 [Russula brevipes]